MTGEVRRSAGGAGWEDPASEPAADSAGTGSTSIASKDAFLRGTLAMGRVLVGRALGGEVRVEVATLGVKT